MLSNSQIGQIGENAAMEHLKSKGYSVVSRNYELPMGEIDIVVKSGRRYRFVEVKTSLDTYRSAFRPEERVDRRKQKRLQGLCETYLSREEIGSNVEWQIDIIAVTLDSEG